MLKEACVEAGGVFLDVTALSKDPKTFAKVGRKIGHEGVRRHHGDKGMQAIAEALLAAMKAR